MLPTFKFYRHFSFTDISVSHISSLPTFQFDRYFSFSDISVAQHFSFTNISVLPKFHFYLYFVDLEIPDNFDPALLEAAEDYELYALSEEFDPSCKKCDDSYNIEKTLRKQLKALQNTKRILQRHSKDKDVELAASREMLAKSLNSKWKSRQSSQNYTATIN